MSTTSANNTRLPDVITDGTGRRINLLDYKAHNIRASWVLMIVTFGLLAALGYGVARAYDPALAVVGVAIAASVALLQNVGAYWFSDRLMLRVANAREATTDEHRYLVNITEAVAIGAGIPAPKLYVIDSPALNAFATGRTPEHAAVAVTTGLIDKLDRQELEGVVAHELAHIKNYDMLFTTLVGATLGALILLRDLVLHSMRYGRRGSSSGNSKGQGVVTIVLLVLLIITPILATLIHFAVSRRREYLADVTGAYITRNPEGLASALEKIATHHAPELKVSESVKHLFFTNPTKKLNARNWFATHPPIEERIARLRRL
ncbi:MAG: M48 family metallopeptidase [Trueperaceae bacterium]|nr:M48 family metallopeptidase [Trueperaceae bacterium]